MYITDITQGKASAIQLLLEKYPDRHLLYVDDKELELRRISIMKTIDFSRLSLFQISYSDTKKYESVPSSLSFQQITSLSEIYG